jgi:hypothetical protein
MSMDDDALDRRLAALKQELATHNPPPAVDRTIFAAIAGRERAASPGARRFSWIGRERTLAWPLALAAALGVIAWTLRAPPPPDESLLGQTAAAALAGTDFIPIVPVADIALTRGAYVVSTQMPRTVLADFGLPVSPVRAAEPVASELLVRADGTVLAVRFLE